MEQHLIRQFSWEVFNNWAGYFTGGGIMAIITLWVAWRGKAMTRRFLIGLTILFFIMGTYKAWKDQHEKAATADSLSDQFRTQRDEYQNFFFSALITNKSSPSVLNASGITGSSVLQGNNNNVSVQNGISESDFRQVLSMKYVDFTEEIQDQFPGGCVVLGTQNGKVIYESRLKDMTLSADWDNAILSIQGTNAYIHVPDVKILIPKYHDHIEGIVINDSWSFKEGVSKRSRVSFGSPNIYYEVLDAGRGIFLIGFK